MKWWQRIFPTSAWKTTLFSRPTTRTWTSSIRTRWKLFSSSRSVIRPSGNICGTIARGFTDSIINLLEGSDDSHHRQTCLQWPWAIDAVSSSRLRENASTIGGSGFFAAPRSEFPHEPRYRPRSLWPLEYLDVRDEGRRRADHPQSHLR